MIKSRYAIPVLLLALCSCSSSSSSTPQPTVTVTLTTPGVIQGNDSDVAWTITGSGFQTGATVTLPYASVTISNVTFVSATSITFTLSADNSTVTGIGTLTVTNPDTTSASASIPAVPTLITLSGHVQPLFTQSCALSGCHSGGSPQAGLDLASGNSFLTTVGVASTQVPALSRIAAGNPDTSYLIDKIEGSQTVGSRMPLNIAPLAIEQIMLLRKWIEAGALNN